MASQRVDAQNHLRAAFVTRIQRQFVCEYNRIVETVFFIYRIRKINNSAVYDEERYNDDDIVLSLILDATVSLVV